MFAKFPDGFAMFLEIFFTQPLEGFLEWEGTPVVFITILGVASGLTIIGVFLRVIGFLQPKDFNALMALIASMVATGFFIAAAAIQGDNAENTLSVTATTLAALAMLAFGGRAIHLPATVKKKIEPTAKPAEAAE